MYKVLIERPAQRDIKRLSEPILGRVLAALHRLEENPRHGGAKMLVGFERQWRVRVGNYRVLYEIDDSDRTAHVYRVVHRSEAYR